MFGLFKSSAEKKENLIDARFKLLYKHSMEGVIVESLNKGMGAVTEDDICDWFDNELAEFGAVYFINSGFKIRCHAYKTTMQGIKETDRKFLRILAMLSLHDFYEAEADEDYYAISPIRQAYELYALRSVFSSSTGYNNYCVDINGSGKGPKLIYQIGQYGKQDYERELSTFHNFEKAQTSITAIRIFKEFINKVNSGAELSVPQARAYYELQGGGEWMTSEQARALQLT